MEEERSLLKGSRVRDYIPALIEHALRDRLRALGFDETHNTVPDSDAGPAGGNVRTGKVSIETTFNARTTMLQGGLGGGNIVGITLRSQITEGSCYAVLGRRRPMRAVFRADAGTVVLPRMDATVEPRTFGLQLRRRRFRVQEVVRVDTSTVERRVERCDLDGAAEVYFVGDVFGRESPLARSAIAHTGEMDGVSFVHWDVMPDPAGKRDVWFVHVHGMGAAPSSTLRSVESVREAGYPSTIVSLEASADIDKRSRGMAPAHLHRVLAAIDHAVSSGAPKVVLVGWSYGARLALEASALRAAVAGAILIAPMLDFVRAFSLVATQRRLPAALIASASAVLTTPILCRLAGAREPMEPLRAPQPMPPLLVIHSKADQSVPFELSRELLQATPAARLIEFPASPHTLEWNVDPERFASEVRTWVESSLQGRT